MKPAQVKEFTPLTASASTGITTGTKPIIKQADSNSAHMRLNPLRFTKTPPVYTDKFERPRIFVKNYTTEYT
jgi:hypothetical protein